MPKNSINLKDELVKDFISKTISKDAYNVLACLERGKTDEQISRKLKMRVNDVRALLNQLHYLGVITYTKEKAKTNNWYTYTWYARKDRIKELLKERFEEEIKELEERLGFEKTYTFFKCKKGCEKLPFEIAFEYDFKCPECGTQMIATDNKKEVKKIEARIRKLKKFLEKA